MKHPWRVLLTTLPVVLFWSFPLALVAALVKAALFPWLEPRKDTLTGCLLSNIAVSLGLCVWKGIRSTRRRHGTGPGSLVRWPLAVAWALLLTIALGFLYQVCFVAALLITHDGLHGLSRLPSALSAWLPDPAGAGYAFYVLSVLFLEPFAAGVFFISSVLAIVLPCVRKSPTAATGMGSPDKPQA
jgi:hypothetical protein